MQPVERGYLYFYIQNLSFENHSKHILGIRIDVHFIVLVQPGLHRDGNNLNTVAHFSCCEDLLMTQSTYNSVDIKTAFLQILLLFA